MTPLRVLVNLTWLVPGVVGGSEESVTDALRAVTSGFGTEVDLVLAVNGSFAGAHPDLADRWQCVVDASSGDNKVRRVLAEQTWLARRTRQLRPDVVHHAGGTVPLVHPGRAALTIHDLQPLDMPANFGLDKRLYLSGMLGRSGRAAQVVHVPSEFTRSRVVDRLGVEPDAVQVVPWSVRVAAEPDPVTQQRAMGELRTMIGERRYLLYPAITYPHKNHLALIDAFEQLAAEDLDTALVLTGGDGPCEDEIRRRIERPSLAGRVVRTGRVPSDILDAWYRDAAAVVFPSLYEGFGLPVLEAMAREVPVVVSDAGSLPEVARPQDLVPPRDVTAWADAMQSVLDLSPSERHQRIREGLQTARSFDAERTAKGLMQVYRRAAGTSGRSPR